jgi:hypothetical protein
MKHEYLDITDANELYSNWKNNDPQVNEKQVADTFIQVIKEQQQFHEQVGTPFRMNFETEERLEELGIDHETLERFGTDIFLLGNKPIEDAEIRHKSNHVTSRYLNKLYANDPTTAQEIVHVISGGMMGPIRRIPREQYNKINSETENGNQ